MKKNESSSPPIVENLGRELPLTREVLATLQRIFAIYILGSLVAYGDTMPNCLRKLSENFIASLNI